MSDVIYRTVNLAGVAETKAAKRTPEDVELRIFRDVPISAETVDRDGDVVRVNGVDTKTYLRQKAPPVFVQHGHANDGLPVARTLKTKRGKLDDGTPALFADVQFRRQGEERTYADDIHDLWSEGYLAASIGFLPDFTATGWIDRDGNEIKNGDSGQRAGRLFKRVELIEWSFVGIPSNREAIQSRGLSAEVKGLFEPPPADVAPVEVKALDPAEFDDEPEPRLWDPRTPGMNEPACEGDLWMLPLDVVARTLKDTSFATCRECGQTAMLYRPSGMLLNHGGDDGRCPGKTAAGKAGPSLDAVCTRVRHGVDVDVPAVREEMIRTGALRLSDRQAKAEIEARVKWQPEPITIQFNREFFTPSANQDMDASVKVAGDASPDATPPVMGTDGAQLSPPETTELPAAVEQALVDAVKEIGASLERLGQRRQGDQEQVSHER